MSRKLLSFQGPPSLAIALNATTPNPGLAGAFAWSTTTSSLLFWNGSNWVSLAAAGVGPMSYTKGSIAQNAASTEIVAANGSSNRTGLTIHNNSLQMMYINYDAAAVVGLSAGALYRIPPGTTWEMPANMIVQAQVRGIWESAGSGFAVWHETTT